MENKQKEILSEIQDMMISIRNQMEKLDAKIYEFSQIVDDELVKPIDLDLDLEEQPSIDLPRADVIDEDLPENGVVALEELAINEEPNLVVEQKVVEHKLVLENAEAQNDKKAVIDNLTMHQSWRKAIPGSPVKDIRSAISLNDRVLFINSLFNQDPVLFQDTISKLNKMNNLDEVLSYLSDKFPNWELDSDTVYRFMMAVRRRVAK